MDWNAIIWFVIWAVVIFAAIGLTIYAVVAVFAARQFKKMNDDMNKGFDHPFFNRR